MEQETDTTIDKMCELIGMNADLITQLQTHVRQVDQDANNNINRVITVVDKQHDTIMSEHNRLNNAFKRIITLEILLAVETCFLIYKFFL